MQSRRTTGRARRWFLAGAAVLTMAGLMPGINSAHADHSNILVYDATPQTQRVDDVPGATGTTWRIAIEGAGVQCDSGVVMDDLRVTLPSGVSAGSSYNIWIEHGGQTYGVDGAWKDTVDGREVLRRDLASTVITGSATVVVEGIETPSSPGDYGDFFVEMPACMFYAPYPTDQRRCPTVAERERPSWCTDRHGVVLRWEHLAGLSRGGPGGGIAER